MMKIILLRYSLIMVPKIALAEWYAILLPVDNIVCQMLTRRLYTNRAKGGYKRIFQRKLIEDGGVLL